VCKQHLGGKWDNSCEYETSSWVVSVITAVSMNPAPGWLVCYFFADPNAGSTLFNVLQIKLLIPIVSMRHVILMIYVCAKSILEGTSNSLG